MAVHQHCLLPTPRLLYERVRGLEVGSYVHLLLVTDGAPKTPGRNSGSFALGTAFDADSKGTGVPSNEVSAYLIVGYDK